jgi:HEAT repeat protein
MPEQGHILTTSRIRERKRAFPLALMLFLALAVLAVLWQAWEPFREPVYRGKPVSSWLERLSRNNPQPEAWTVLYDEIGPDAIPALKRAVKQNDSALRRAYRTVFPRLPLTLQRPLPKPRRMENLLMGIQGLLAKLGTRSIPILVRLFHDPDPGVRIRSLLTLVEMKADKTEAIPALISLLKDGDSQFQSIAADVLSHLGPAARAAAPDLSRLLGATNAEVQIGASLALWHIDRDTNVLSVIVRNLNQSS